MREQQPRGHLWATCALGFGSNSPRRQSSSSSPLCSRRSPLPCGLPAGKSAPDMTSLGWLLVGTGLAFAIVLLWGFAGWARSRWMPNATKPATAVDTGLRLRFFGDDRQPQVMEMRNIFRWFSLKNIVVGRDPAGVEHEVVITNIFVVFDQPTTVPQIVATSPDFVMPRHEFKDISARHTILAVTGNVPAGELEIRMVRLGS